MNAKSTSAAEKATEDVPGSDAGVGDIAAEKGTVACAACGAEQWQDKPGQDACKDAEQCDWDQNCVSDPVASKTAAGDSCEYETKLYMPGDALQVAASAPHNAPLP